VDADLDDPAGDGTNDVIGDDPLALDDSAEALR
jgi:hypothetical protein